MRKKTWKTAMTLTAAACVAASLLSGCKKSEENEAEKIFRDMNQEQVTAYLMESELRVIDIETTLEKTDETHPLAQEVTENGETFWAVTRYSGKIEGTDITLKEIDTDDPYVTKAYEGSDGNIYAHSSQTVPDEENPEFYIYVIRQDIFKAGMSKLSELYSESHPVPATPVAKDVLYVAGEEGKPGTVTVVADVDKTVSTEVTITIYDQNMNPKDSISVPVDEKYSISYTDDGECAYVGIATSYIPEGEQSYVYSNTSNLLLIPNSYYTESMENPEVIEKQPTEEVEPTEETTEPTEPAKDQTTGETDTNPAE